MRKNKNTTKPPLVAPVATQPPDLLQELMRVLQGHATTQVHTPATPSTKPVVTPRKNVGKGPCSMPGCEDLEYAKGLCTKHYHRKLRGRDVDGPSAVRNAVQVGTSVSRETYQTLIDSAQKSDVSPFRAARWILEKWAQNERLLHAKNERSPLETDP